MYRTVGCPDAPLEARARPARAGPIERQRSAERTFGDCAMAVDQTAAKPRMTDEIRMGGVCSLREERATPPDRSLAHYDRSRHRTAVHGAVVLIDSGRIERDRVGAARLHRAAREYRGPHRAHAVPGVSARIRIPRPRRRPADRDGIHGRIAAAVVSTRELNGSADGDRSDGASTSTPPPAPPPPPPRAASCTARPTSKIETCWVSDLFNHGSLLDLPVCGSVIAPN